MKTFRHIDELIASLIKQDYPKEIIESMLSSMYDIEKGFGTKGNEKQETVYLVIAENEQDEESVYAQYPISNTLPEIEEVIRFAREQWRKQIFVFGNGGDGIIYYRREAIGGENGTE